MSSTGGQEPILAARGLVKRYGRVTALDQADFDLMEAERSSSAEFDKIVSRAA